MNRGPSRWHSNRWAAEKRDELLLLLGGACAWCGGTDDLSFDHIVPTGWVPSRHSWSQRMAEYRRAHKAGNLQLLCGKHHGRKTRLDEERDRVDAGVDPF